MQSVLYLSRMPRLYNNFTQLFIINKDAYSKILLYNFIYVSFYPSTILYLNITYFIFNWYCYLVCAQNRPAISNWILYYVPKDNLCCLRKKFRGSDPTSLVCEREREQEKKYNYSYISLFFLKEVNSLVYYYWLLVSLYMSWRVCGSLQYYFI